MVPHILIWSRKYQYLCVWGDGVLEGLTGQWRNRFFRASEIFEIINKPLDQIHRGDQ